MASETDTTTIEFTRENMNVLRSALFLALSTADLSKETKTQYKFMQSRLDNIYEREFQRV